MGWADLVQHRWNSNTKAWEYPNHATTAPLVYNKDNCQFEPPGLDQNATSSIRSGANMRIIDHDFYREVQKKSPQAALQLTGRRFADGGFLDVPQPDEKPPESTLGDADITDIVRFLTDANKDDDWIVVRKSGDKTEVLNFRTRKLEKRGNLLKVDISKAEIQGGV